LASLGKFGSHNSLASLGKESPDAKSPPATPREREREAGRKSSKKSPLESPALLEGLSEEDRALVLRDLAAAEMVFLQPRGGRRLPRAAPSM